MPSPIQPGVRSCRVCAHPQRSDLDNELRRGVLSNRELGPRFGISRHSVDRHVKLGHVPEDKDGNAPGKPFFRPGQVDPNDHSPLGVMKRSMNTLLRVDTRKLAPKQLLEHADAMRRAAEAIAKLEPARRTTVQLSEVQGLDTFIGILFQELEDLPEVRERIAARLDEIDFEVAV